MAGYDPKKTRAAPASPGGNGKTAVDAVLEGPPPDPGPRAAPNQPGPTFDTVAETPLDRRLLAAGGLLAVVILLLLLWRRR
jgi:hypothetical protein